MKTTIIATTLCLLGSAAYAGGTHDMPHGQPSGGGTVSGQQSQFGINSLNNKIVNGNRNDNRNSNANNNANRNRNSLSGTNTVTVNNAAGNNGGGSGNYYSNYSARGNTPDVILGSPNGGNPCGMGAGVTGSGPGAGGALAWMWEGDGCDRREDAKLLNNLGFSRVEMKTRLCEGGSWFTPNPFRRTFWNAGDPCPQDRAEFAKQRQAQGYYQRQDGYWAHR